jgi:uncharacterized repeat protein (TIGR03803 family)
MKKLLLGFLFGMMGVGLCLHSATAQTYTEIHAFQGPDGSEPKAGVTLGADGSIYGTTSQGGPNPHASAGVVFKSDPSGNLTTLHAFDLTDGIGPGSLTLLGNILYGGVEGGQCGFLFSVNTDGSGFSDFYDFAGTTGCAPVGKLQWDPGYGFIGITEDGGPAYHPGGPYGHGVLFLLTKGGTYRALHDFGQTGDGITPTFAVVDKAGNVYGSTQEGGAPCVTYSAGCGILFKLNLPARQYSILYSFTGESDGAAPILGSIGADGTLYGATQSGTGVTKYGTLFALQPSASGYTLTTLSTFGGTLGEPTSGPTLTADGRLVGVTTSGLYAYNLNTRTLKVLQLLNSDATGFQPAGQPAVAKDGTIYGTTQFGGEPACNVNDGCGVLYSYATP